MENSQWEKHRQKDEKQPAGKAKAAGWKTVSGKSKSRRMENSQREKRIQQDEK